jgi:multiple sugar transport system permease protein
MNTNRGIMSDVEWRSLSGRFTVTLFLVILLLISLSFLFPFFFAFTAGLKTSSEIVKPGLHLLPDIAHWENYTEAWRRYNMVRMFLNTFIVAIGGVAGRLFVSAMAAYSISRLKPFGKNVIMSLILLTLTIPGIAYLIPLYIVITDVPLLHVNLVNTYLGLWLPYAGSAFVILVLKNSFDQIPQDYYDAAAVDGASPIRMFFTFTLPLSAPILLVLGLLAFVGMWGDFLLPYLVLRNSEVQTVSVRLFALVRDFPLNLQMAGAFIALLPPLVAVLFLQRYMRGGITF